MRLHKRAARHEEQRILDARPELDDCAEDVLRCWRDLESERPLIPGVVGMIPYRAILAWAEVRCWDRGATVLLADVVRYLDGKRVERENSKRALGG